MFSRIRIFLAVCSLALASVVISAPLAAASPGSQPSTSGSDSVSPMAAVSPCPSWWDYGPGVYCAQFSVRDQCFDELNFQASHYSTIVSACEGFATFGPWWLVYRTH